MIYASHAHKSWEWHSFLSLTWHDTVNRNGMPSQDKHLIVSITSLITFFSKDVPIWLSVFVYYTHNSILFMTLHCLVDVSLISESLVVMTFICHLIWDMPLVYQFKYCYINPIIGTTQEYANLIFMVSVTLVITQMYYWSCFSHNLYSVLEALYMYAYQNGNIFNNIQ